MERAGAGVGNVCVRCGELDGRGAVDDGCNAQEEASGYVCISLVIFVCGCGCSQGPKNTLLWPPLWLGHMDGGQRELWKGVG